MTGTEGWHSSGTEVALSQVRAQCHQNGTEVRRAPVLGGTGSGVSIEDTPVPPRARAAPFATCWPYGYLYMHHRGQWRSWPLETVKVENGRL